MRKSRMRIWIVITVTLFSYELTCGALHIDPAAEFAVNAGAGHQGSPAIWGEWVVWYDGTADIYGKNLSSGENIRISNSGSADRYPAIYDGLVVWADKRNGDYDIYGYDLATRTESTLHIGQGDQIHPAINSDKVVWRNGNEIWCYSINQDTAILISDSPGHKWHPDVFGDIVVWGDYRNNNWDIYGYDLKSNNEFQITTNSKYQRSVAIYGNKVVYDNDFGLGCYDLVTQQHTYYDYNSGNDWIDIYGDIAVWGDYRDGNYNIFGLNISSEETFIVCNADNNQYSPAIFENTVVWSDDRNSPENYGYPHRDIYGNIIVPEPATLLLLGLGGLALLTNRRFR